MKRAGVQFVRPVDPKDKTKGYRPSTYEETILTVSNSIRDIKRLCERSKTQPPPHAKAGRMPEPPVPINHYNVESTITEYAMKKFLELGNNNDRARVEPRVASVLKEAKTNKQQKGEEERIAQSKASKDKKIAAKDKEKEAALKLAREEIVMLKQSIAKKEMELEGKDRDIAKKDEKLKSKDLDIARKDKQIAYMKSVVKQQRGQIRQLESMLDPVDLTTEEEGAEPPNKRARTEEETPKSILAIQHESIKLSR